MKTLTTFLIFFASIVHAQIPFVTWRTTNNQTWIQQNLCVTFYVTYNNVPVNTIILYEQTATTAAHQVSVWQYPFINLTVPSQLFGKCYNPMSELGVHKFWVHVQSPVLSIVSDTLRFTIVSRDPRYSCDNVRCYPNFAGQYASLAQCQAVCGVKDKFACIGGNCQPSVTGYGTLEQCVANCGYYSCEHGTCHRNDLHGQYDNIDTCQAHCLPEFYRCGSSNGCLKSQDKDDFFTSLAECEAHCGIVFPHYVCRNGKCEVSATGFTTLIQCNYNCQCQ